MTLPALVDLPTSKISRKKMKNGTTYIYYRTRFYRDENGKAKFDEVAIGKLDPETGKLIPNRNYAELFMTSEPVLPQRIQSAGIGIACDHLVEELGLKSILQTIFPQSSDLLLALAYYMLAKGNVLSYAADWLEETALSFQLPSLSSQTVSRLFQQLTADQCMTFFEQWTISKGTQDYWLYDVTSISSYAKGIEQVEWGYNRDHDTLPQLNLGMCYGQSSRLPLFYQLYNGSIPDKSFFPYVLATFPFASSESIQFVLDQGFITKANLEEMTEEDSNYQLLSLLPHHWIDTKRIVGEHGTSLQSTRYYLPDLNIHARTLMETVQGVPVTVHLYYDRTKASIESNLLLDRIYRLEEELKTVGKSPLKKKKYQTFFQFDVPSDAPIHYERNTDAIDEAIARSGYFALISTNPQLSAADALMTYREKDAIEKVFDGMKNGLDFKRFRTHTQQTTDGKVFVAFLSLIIRAAIRNKIALLPSKEQFTLPEVVVELTKIKQVETQEGSYHYMPLTGKQKKLLTVLGVNIDKFKIQ